MTIANKFARRLCMLLAACGLVAGTAQAQTVIYYHTDALGSPVATTNAAGVVIERTEYEPYGQVLNPPVKDGPGYAGHVSDAQTGLSYMQQRYYDPQIGRFLSMDPVTANANTGSNFNRYWYANNNPYRFTDPDGRDAQDILGGFVDGMASNFLATPSLIQVRPTDIAPQPFGGSAANVGNADYGAGRKIANGLTTVIDVAATGFGAGGLVRPGAGGLLKEARGARNALSESLAPLRGKAPATVTGGYNTRTGEVAARACGGGNCAETNVVRALGGNKAEVKFTEAIRPRTGAQVPVCANCEATYSRDAFPPETKFQTDG